MNTMKNELGNWRDKVNSNRRPLVDIMTNVGLVEVKITGHLVVSTDTRGKVRTMRSENITRKDIVKILSHPGMKKGEFAV